MKQKQDTEDLIGTVYDDDEIPEQEIEEEFRGHRIVCTCDDDPDWCEKHNVFA